MHTSDTEVSHTLPLSCSSGRWCHPISDGNASALKTQGEALVLRSALFRFTRAGKTTLVSELFTTWKCLCSVISSLSPTHFPSEVCSFHTFQNYSDGFFSSSPFSPSSQSWVSVSSGLVVAHLWRVTVVFGQVTRTSPSSPSITINISRVGPRPKWNASLRRPVQGYSRGIFCDMMWWFGFVC